MGVKGLSTIIKEFAKSSIKKREFKDYRGTVQSLDAAITLYKFCIAIMNTDNFRSENGDIIGHLFACFFKSLAMLRYGIMPLWTVDGTPPIIKQSTLTERRKVKENAILKLSNIGLNSTEKNKLEKRTFTVSMKHIDEVKYLLRLLGLPYVEAPGEAEAQCAALDIANVSQGVVTEDWDAVLFGCKKMLKDFSNKSYVTEIDVPELMRALEMNRKQLINLAAILGNDYCCGIGGLKPTDAYLKFKTCNFDIETFLVMIENENKIKSKYKIPENFREQLEISRDYYLHAPVVDPKEVKVIWNKPDYNKLYSYLIDEKKFKPDVIFVKIAELKMMYERYVLSGGELITLSRIKKEQGIVGPCESYKSEINYVDYFLDMLILNKQLNKRLLVAH